MSLRSADPDAPTEGVAVGVTIGVKYECADWLSLNYPVKANFRSEIMKNWTQMGIGYDLQPGST